MAAPERRVDPGDPAPRGVPGPERPGDDGRLLQGVRAHRRGPRRDRGATAAEIAEIEGVSNVITPQGAATAGIPAPYVSEDGQVAKLDFTINRGDALWEDMPDVADEIRDITAIDGVEVYVAGAGGTTADQAAAFAGMDGRLLLITLCAVDPDPADQLPQPGAVGAADLLRRRESRHRDGCALPAGQVRRHDDQRPDPVHHDRAGDRRWDGLRPAAGRPISRRAPPPRGPARGDGVRAAPRRTGHLRQRHDRRRRPALPDVRRAQLHRRTRPGQRRRGGASPSSSW